MKLLISVALIFVASAGGSSGRCPKPVFKEDFDFSRYLGVWYEIVRSNNVGFESGDCNYQNVVQDSDGVLSFENYQRIDGQYDGVTWNAFCDPRQNFLRRCYFRPSQDSSWFDYQVVSTDYDNYVVVYSCTSVKNSHVDYVWVGGRNKNLDWTLYQDIVVNQLGFSLEELNTNVQNGGTCPSNSPV